MGLSINDYKIAESLLNQILTGLSSFKLSGNLDQKVQQCAKLLDEAFQNPKIANENALKLERKVQMLVNIQAKFEEGISKTATKAVETCNQHMSEVLKISEKQPDPSLLKLPPAVKAKIETAIKKANEMNIKVTEILISIAITKDLVFGNNNERFVNLDLHFLENTNDAFKKVNHCTKEITAGFRSIGMSGDMKDWQILSEALTKLESEKFDKATKTALAECRKAADAAKAEIEKDLKK